MLVVTTLETQITSININTQQLNIFNTLYLFYYFKNAFEIP